jgi:8-oxo-dGTP pyrophosphatase MutT (NUDIX family)
MRKERVEGDYRYTIAEEPGFRYEHIITPRGVFITPELEVLLHRYKDTSWWGLPGGKVSTHELKQTRRRQINMQKELYEQGLMYWGRTLRREMLEEVGVPISHHALRSRAELIAHITVTIIDNDPLKPSTLVAKQAYTPLYYSLLNLDNRTVDDNNLLVPMNGPMPGPLFPDASEALQFVRTQLARGWDSSPNPRRNLNMLLGPPGGYYFQMKPGMGLLMNPPPWLVKMIKISGNVY